jgi:carbon-monoxide dehydrogenase small subunit
MIISVQALLTENPHPSQNDIEEGLSGNLCRCTGYGGIMRAIEKLVK